MLLLDVPYAEKDEAKALGARWNPDKKKWFVQERQNYPKFEKWILPKDQSECMILCDRFYIAIGDLLCYKCRQITSVVGFGVESRFVIDKDDDGNVYFAHNGGGEINIASQIEPLPLELLDHLKQNYNYYLDYSKTVNSKYYANHCNHCKALQVFFYFQRSRFSIFY